MLDSCVHFVSHSASSARKCFFCETNHIKPIYQLQAIYRKQAIVQQHYCIIIVSTLLIEFNVKQMCYYVYYYVVQSMTVVVSLTQSCPIMFSVKKEVIEVYIKFFFTSVCMASLQVQMLFNNEFLPDHMTMKRLWLSHWFGKVQCTHCQLAQINATYFFTPEQFLCTRIQLVNKEKVLRCIIKNSSHSLKSNLKNNLFQLNKTLSLEVVGQVLRYLCKMCVVMYISL